MTISRLSSCHAYPALRRAEKPAANEGRVDVRSAAKSDGDPYDFYCPSSIESPIQPPWRVLPWPADARVGHVRPSAAVLIKAAHCRADVSGVGRTLDVFV